MNHRTVTVLLASSGILGCGSSSPSSAGARAAQGPISVNGTFSGNSLAAQDAIAQIQTQMITGAPIASADVEIANVGSLCALAQRRANSPSVGSLHLGVGGPGTQIAPGSYALGGSGNDGTFGSAFFWLEDAHCNAALNEVGMSGTITISAASASSLSGSFDIVFYRTSATGAVGGSGDHVTGSFDAAVCSVAPADGGTRACGS
jgi:hypothetical protein